MTKIVKTRDDIKALKAEYSGKSIALVPTMGNLHEGHMSLMRIAKQHSEIVVVSIFVNPTQFGVNEDLDKYPRTFESDLEKMRSIGVDAVFFPDVETVYPHGSDSTLSILLPSEMTNILCGLGRPTHFQGVATIVAKLLQLIRPDVAVFGEKDFQQLAIVRRLVEELFVDTEIISGEIVRDSSGLALSSRNQYLSSEELIQARQLSATLRWCREQLREGKERAAVFQSGQERLVNVGVAVEYLEMRDVTTLAENPPLQRGILLIAARVGTTRLIDNLRIES